MKKVIIGISIVVVLGLVGAVVWLFMSGKLVWADNQVQSGDTTIVCGKDVVDRYNEVMFFGLREGDSEPTIDEAGIAEVRETIRGLDGYENDPTCQTILFWIAVTNEEYEPARDANNALLTMYDQDRFPNNNIRGTQPLFTHQALVDNLSPEGQNREGIGDDGA